MRRFERVNHRLFDADTATAGPRCKLAANAKYPSGFPCFRGRFSFWNLRMLKGLIYRSKNKDVLFSISSGGI